MNLAISDTRTDYPEGVAYTFEKEGSCICRFSHAGNLVAIGTVDGSVAVADLVTKGIVRDLVGHVAPVTGLSFDTTGRYLLSSSKDWNCILWDLSVNFGSAKVFVLRFSSPVVACNMLTTKEGFRIVACCLNQYPYLIALEWGPTGLLEERRKFLVTLDEGDVDLTKSSDYIQTTTASMDTTAKYVFLGNAKGTVTVLDLESQMILFHFRPSGTSAIRGFQFSPDGLIVAVNSADKTLRCYTMVNVLTLSDTGSRSDIQTLEPNFKYFDSVDQNRWVQCAYTADSKYFIGGSAVKNSHKIYIWDRETCGLTKLLEIQKDSLLDIAVHPKYPILISVSSIGIINVWTVKVHENWSAFAPDFRELDENAEYEEQEDEFDVIEGAEKRIQKGREESELVDIMGIDGIDQDDFFYISGS